MEPESAEVELLGKAVGALQTGIEINNGFVTGTLKHVTGYTGFSGDPELQEGNFLALKFTATEDSTTTVYITDPAGTRSVVLDSDMQLVARIADKEAQTLRIVTEKDGMASKEINLDLTGLRLL